MGTMKQTTSILTYAIAWRIIFPMLLVNFTTLFAQGTGSDSIYEAKMISFGHNRPSLDINQDGLLELCAELHQRIDLATIRERHG